MKAYSLCIALIIGASSLLAQRSTLSNSVVNIDGQSIVALWVTDNPDETTYPNYPKSYFGFHKGDTIILDFATLNKKGKQMIEIEHLESGSIIYSNYKIYEESGITIPVHETGVYEFEFGTNHLFNRKCRAVIQRAKGPEAPDNFSSTVYWREVQDTSYVTSEQRVLVGKDTVSQLVANKTFRVYSTTNLSNPPKTVVPLSIPPRTTYWTLYLGVGQESKNQFQEFAKVLASGAALVTNPVLAFGLGMIDDLPYASATSTVSFKTTDVANSQAFMAGQEYSYYTNAPLGNNMSAYIHNFRMKDTPLGGNGLRLCFSNSHLSVGQDVDMQVYAFTVKNVYETQTVTEAVVTSKEVAELR